MERKGFAVEELGSKEICAAAVKMAITDSRESEGRLKQELKEKGILAAAVDFGSDFNTAVPKVLERAVVAAKREGLISDIHSEEGAVAGAAHEALEQMVTKCIGLNLGGKIGIARCGEHISVCLYFAVGLLNLSDIAIGLGHRVV